LHERLALGGGGLVNFVEAEVGWGIGVVDDCSYVTVNSADACLFPALRVT